MSKLHNRPASIAPVARILKPLWDLATQTVLTVRVAMGTAVGLAMALTLCTALCLTLTLTLSAALPAWAQTPSTASAPDAAKRPISAKAPDNRADPSLAPPELRAAQPGPRVVLTKALTVPGGGDHYPTDTKPVLVELPHEWSRTSPGFTGSIWYRSQFTPPTGLLRGDILSLYIEHVCSTVQVYLNGQLLHSSGFSAPSNAPPSAFTTPKGASSIHDCNHPQLVTLPTGLLREQGNELDIKVSGHALSATASRQRAGGLSTLVIAPQSELAPLHSRQTALQVGAPQALSATLALMGSFMFVLGFINRRESHLAYFGAMCVGWAGVSSRMWLRTLPTSHASAEFFVCALLGFIAWAAVQFLLRYSGTRSRAADVALPLQCAGLTLSLALAGPSRLNMVATLWYVVLAAEVCMAALWYLRSQRHSGSLWVMGGMLLAVSASAVIEATVQWGRAPAFAAQVAELLAPIVVVLVGLRLVQQHGHALQNAEEDKVLLEQRVREAAAEIERNFRQLAELRVEQVTERERKRIAADLHDDLGAKLLTIVHTSESERISTLAREALEEMRLSVRGLTGKAVRLADALGDWRAEVISRLAQTGIDAEWKAPEELPHTLSARAYVQTTRILREATSNIIKHSKARSCSVTAGISDGDFTLVIEDDGGGISSEVEGRLDRGHGLASMKNRAKQMQGQCLVESVPGYGTVIRLTIPLNISMENS
jgi:two-component system, NarL family, sensor histidine kinase UhpB